MLTDDELATMISGRYGDVALAVPLDAVQRRGDRRRRNGRLASVIALAVLLIGGATAWITAGSTVSTAGRISSDCDRQYATMAASPPNPNGLPQVAVGMPKRLPAPIIDMHSGTADFRLYLADGNPYQVLFDCGHTTAGAVSGHLTVNPRGTDPTASTITLPPGGQDYRDYLPDGSGALVGLLRSGASSVRVTAADGTTIAATVAHGYFVAWSPSIDLGEATVRFYDATGALVKKLTAPTGLAGVFDESIFLAACRGLLDRPAGGGVTYVGDRATVLEASTSTSGGLVNDAVAVYLGSATVVCQYNGGAFLHTYPLPADATSYGWLAFCGNGDLGWAIGIVPPDTTKVKVMAQNGTVVATADAERGLFMASIPAAVLAGPGTSLVTISPTGTHRYPDPQAIMK